MGYTTLKRIDERKQGDWLNGNDIHYTGTTENADSSINFTGYARKFNNDFYASTTPSSITAKKEEVEEQKELPTAQAFNPKGNGASTTATATVTAGSSTASISSPAASGGSSTRGDRYVKRSDYKKALEEAYTKAVTERGLNPNIAKCLVVKDLLESWSGKSGKTVNAGTWNFGNIIALGNQQYTQGGDHDGKGNPITQKFRNYSSLEEYVNDSLDMFMGINGHGNRYSSRHVLDDPSKFFQRIHEAGYATSPTYATSLNSLYRKEYGEYEPNNIG